MLCRWPTAFSNNLWVGCVCSISKCLVKEKTVSMSCKVTDESVAEQFVYYWSYNATSPQDPSQAASHLLSTVKGVSRGVSSYFDPVSLQVHWPLRLIRRGKQDEATTVSISPQLQLWTFRTGTNTFAFYMWPDNKPMFDLIPVTRM